jgi:hypothetical protein
MRKTWLRRAGAVAVCLATYLGVAEVARLVGNAAPPCERAVDFVKAYASQLPTTYDGHAAR